MPRKVVGAKVVDEGGEGEYCSPMLTQSPSAAGDNPSSMAVLGPGALRLHELMAEFGWKCPDVGRLVRRGSNLVRQWRCGWRNVPDHMIELLEYKADEIRRKSALKETT